MAGDNELRLSDEDSDDAYIAAIVNHSSTAIVSKDLDGTVRVWNSAAEETFGWQGSEIIGRSIRAIIPPDRLDEEERILSEIAAGRSLLNFETVRLHKEGASIPVAISVSPIRNRVGKIVGASKFVHDTTVANALRTKLEESERQFRMLANNIPQLAWMADRDGSIFWYNDRWFDYTGTTLEEMRGWGWTSVHHPDHVERVTARIQQSWDTGIEWEDTFPLRSRDGEYRWFLSRAKPLLDEQGQVWRWFGTNTDITQQRESEQKIQLLMGEVNHRAKNMIAVVQGLVARTADKQFSATFANRLQALARNQDILTKRNWDGAPIGELIRSQLAAVGDLVGVRISLDGALDFVLSPAAAETIGLAIHELSTNAAKHGALSTENGKVAISCSVDDAPGQPRFIIEWREFDGPMVRQPSQSGFGTVMIDRNPKLALGAEVAIGYPASGFFWRLTAPLDRLRAVPGSAAGL